MAQRVRKKPTATSRDVDAMSSRAATELQRTAALKANWDSYGAPAPNAKAVAAAQFVLKVLHSMQLVPVRVMPSTDGGVALVLSNPPYYVDIECFNNGKIMIGYSPDHEDSRVVEVTRATLSREVPRLRAIIETNNSATDAESGSEG